MARRATDSGVWVELTTGNIRNNHIYFRDFIDFFPSDAVGGSNKAAVASKLIVVTFEPGSTVETDLDGQKRFLRNRSAVREFFEKSKAKAGDIALISQTAPRRYSIRLAPR